MKDTGPGGGTSVPVLTLEGNVEQKTEPNTPTAVRQTTGGALRGASGRSSTGQCSSEGQPVTGIQSLRVFRQAFST